MPTPKKNGRYPSKPTPRNSELTRAKRILRAHLPALREQYSVTSLGVFGSYVRGEQKKRSDLEVPGYELHGLTQEEIKVVGGSSGGWTVGSG